MHRGIRQVFVNVVFLDPELRFGSRTTDYAMRVCESTTALRQMGATAGVTALVRSNGQSAFLLDEIEWPMVYPALTSRGGVEIHGGGCNAPTPRRISSGPYLCLCRSAVRQRPRCVLSHARAPCMQHATAPAFARFVARHCHCHCLILAWVCKFGLL